MAKDHALANGDGAVYIGESAVLVFYTLAHDVVLFNVGQRLLLAPQPNDNWIGNDGFGKFHHLVLIRGREQQHLAVG